MYIKVISVTLVIFLILSSDAARADVIKQFEYRVFQKKRIISVSVLDNTSNKFLLKKADVPKGFSELSDIQNIDQLIISNENLIQGLYYDGADLWTYNEETKKWDQGILPLKVHKKITDSILHKTKVNLYSVIKNDVASKQNAFIEAQKNSEPLLLKHAYENLEKIKKFRSGDLLITTYDSGKRPP